jgi:hypothetical protein
VDERSTNEDLTYVTGVRASARGSSSVLCLKIH